MSDQTTPAVQGPPPMGDNQPPQDPQELAAAQALALCSQGEMPAAHRRAQELAEAAEAYLGKNPAINDEATAERVNDFMAQLKAAMDKLDAQRTLLTEPRRLLVDAINALVRPNYAKMVAARKLCRARLDDYLTRKEAALEQERQRAAQEAAEKEEAARQAQEAAAAGDSVEAQVQAEEATKAAKTATKAAGRLERTQARVGSASGGTRATSRRASYRVEITDWGKVWRKFGSDERVRAALQKLVEAEVRHSPELKAGTKTLPGVTVHKE